MPKPVRTRRRYQSRRIPRGDAPMRRAHIANILRENACVARGARATYRARGLLAIRHMQISPRRSLCMVGVAALIVASACSDSDPADVQPEPEPEPDPQPLPAVVVEEGSTIGAATFPPGNTATGGQGTTISGIGCLGTPARHYHAHVSLFFEGDQKAVPGAIGITDPMFRDDYVIAGDCWYWMHTHDATGVVHIEPPNDGAYTLGQLFDVWGQSLSSDGVAGFDGDVSVFVDGTRHSGDPRDIVLTSRKHVSLQVGRPLAPIPMYIFQN
jgi:hypothetical protein